MKVNHQEQDDLEDFEACLDVLFRLKERDDLVEAKYTAQFKDTKSLDPLPFAISPSLLDISNVLGTSSQDRIEWHRGQYVNDKGIPQIVSGHHEPACLLHPKLIYVCRSKIDENIN